MKREIRSGTVGLLDGVQDENTHKMDKLSKLYRAAPPNKVSSCRMRSSISAISSALTYGGGAISDDREEDDEEERPRFRRRHEKSDENTELEPERFERVDGMVSRAS